MCRPTLRHAHACAERTPRRFAAQVNPTGCKYGHKITVENMGGALTPGETASINTECNPPPEVGGAAAGERARIVVDCSIPLSAFDTDSNAALNFDEARAARETLRAKVENLPYTMRCHLPPDVRASPMRWPLTNPNPNP